MFVKLREKCKQRTAPAARNFCKISFLIRRIDEIFNKRSAGNKRAALATFGVARGQGRMARLEKCDLRNKRHPRSDDASEKKHLGMTTLLCGATFQGLESARQTAPTKRKVYEDFTTTLMRRRENRAWSSYWKRRREPSWGKKNTDERYSYGFVCVVVSPHHPRQGFTIRAIHLQVWRRAQTVLCTEGTAPEDQTRRVRQACKVSKAGTGFQV